MIVKINYNGPSLLSSFYNIICETAKRYKENSVPYRFFPNALADELFGKKETHNGDHLVPLLEEALGKDNWKRHGFPQSPLQADNTKGEVEIVLNPNEPDITKFQYASVGTVQHFTR